VAPFSSFLLLGAVCLCRWTWAQGMVHHLLFLQSRQQGAAHRMAAQLAPPGPPCLPAGDPRYSPSGFRLCDTMTL